MRLKFLFLVDADTGHGNALQARRTVKMLIQAGAAGCFMEDQKAPKRCGFVKGKQLISVDEAVGKYRAICDVRDEIRTLISIIMARTDARGAVGGGLEETKRRAKAYADAGVDVIYAEALQSREEVRSVRASVPNTLFRATERAIKPPLTRAEKDDLDLCMTSIHIPVIGTVAMHDFLMDLKNRAEDALIEDSIKKRRHIHSADKAFST